VEQRVDPFVITAIELDADPEVTVCKVEKSATSVGELDLDLRFWLR
jgi:hypothetical protein